MTHGPVMLDLEGLQLQPAEREMLQHPAAGGVILFSRNMVDAAQITALIAEIHAVRTPPLLVAVDQEGGRVQRFRQDFTRLPAAAAIGARYRTDATAGRQLARDLGWLMATELRSCGVDFSFAPVLDLDHGRSAVIGDRAFGRSAAQVSDLACAWAQGARDAGMASVGKHFPGHGGVVADSHHALPEDERTLEQLRAADLEPFRRAIDNGLEAIMPAHVIYRAVDDQCAGFSARWLKQILRRELGFQGVIFSDDLSMAAAAVGGDYPARAHLALAAGCDMVLVCNAPAAASAVLDALRDYHDPVAQSRLVRLHGRQQRPRAEVQQDPRWRTIRDRVAQLGMAAGEADAAPELPLAPESLY